MTKKSIVIWRYIIIGLMVVTAYLLYYTNKVRVEYGYFENPEWIFYNSLAYILFFGLVTGFVLTSLINKTRK